MPAAAINADQIALGCGDFRAQRPGLLHRLLAGLLEVGAPFQSLLGDLFHKDRVEQLLHLLHLLIDAAQFLVPGRIRLQGGTQLIMQLGVAVVVDLPGGPVGGFAEVLQAIVQLGELLHVVVMQLLFREQSIGVEKQRGDPAEKACDQDRGRDDPTLGQGLPVAQPRTQ
jgi:hypothetical protein